MNVVVVDTGLGNVRSVVRALEAASKVHASVVVSRDADLVSRADALVVPGQGAFRDCASAIADAGLGDAIRASITRGAPFLGICLGLQVLFDESDEAPGCAGLGIFRGRVARLAGNAAERIKVPHVGWNTVEPARSTWLLKASEPFYFVHSYVVVPEDASLACATTEHGERFVSAIEKDNVAAVQFHPEKSQRAGLALLERFLAK